MARKVLATAMLLVWMSQRVHAWTHMKKLKPPVRCRCASRKDATLGAGLLFLREFLLLTPGPAFLYPAGKGFWKAGFTFVGVNPPVRARPLVQRVWVPRTVLYVSIAVVQGVFKATSRLHNPYA